MSNSKENKQSIGPEFDIIKCINEDCRENDSCERFRQRKKNGVSTYFFPDQYGNCSFKIEKQLENEPMLIYLASPYSHDVEAIRISRFERACKCAADLMKIGYHVLSPIAHSHPMVKYGLPGDWKFWKECDELIISKCDELWVLKLPGWEKSTGVAAETEIAKKLGLKIKYVTLKKGKIHTITYQPTYK